MGILIQTAIRDMNEAMTLENLGANIDLMPEGASLRHDPEEQGLWAWLLPIYAKDVPLTIFFYTDQGMSLNYTMAMQGAVSHDITEEEQAVLEEAFEWLFTEGEFDVTQKAEEK